MTSLEKKKTKTLHIHFNITGLYKFSCLRLAADAAELQPPWKREHLREMNDFIFGESALFTVDCSLYTRVNGTQGSLPKTAVLTK